MSVNLQVMEKDRKSNLEEVVSIDSKEEIIPKIRENADTKENITPKIGMEFDSEEEAYLYYNIYIYIYIQMGVSYIQRVPFRGHWGRKHI